MPSFHFRSVVLDAPEPRELGRFYQQLTGWSVTSDEPDWFRLEPAPGATGLAIQAEPKFVRPMWPSEVTHQQMQSHLDLQVGNLDEAAAHAQRCGAVLAEFQPQDDVRVLLDPVGHPFCLFVN